MAGNLSHVEYMYQEWLIRRDNVMVPVLLLHAKTVNGHGREVSVPWYSLNMVNMNAGQQFGLEGNSWHQ